MSEWVMLGRVEIPFEAEEGEANAKSKEMAAEIEAKVGTRVGVVTVRRWLWEATIKRPDPPKLVGGPPGMVSVKGRPGRRMGLGPQG